MQVYKCDACRRIIEDPFEIKMKEFDIEAIFDDKFVYPHNHKQKVKIDLCDDCYHNLNNLAVAKISKDKRGGV